jgi:hypothetical protein
MQFKPRDVSTWGNNIIALYWRHKLLEVARYPADSNGQRREKASMLSSGMGVFL